MPEYKLRYPCDQQKQQAYEDACDCISSGVGMTAWKSCGLSLSQRYKVWWRAAQDVGNLEMVQEEESWQNLK